MLKTFFIICASFVFCEQYSSRCSNSSEDGVSFKSSDDGVDGRYNVEWCTTVHKNFTTWELTLRYYENRSPNYCQKFSVAMPSGLRHSHKEIQISEFHCTNVCLNTHLDLIFNGTCYHIKTSFKNGPMSRSPTDALIYIENPYSKETFTESITHVATSLESNRTLVRMFLSYIPAEEYAVELCSSDNRTEHEVCEEVTAGCRVVDKRRTAVVCDLPPALGCHSLRFHHLNAAWESAVAFRGHYAFKHAFCLTENPVVVDGSGWWTAGKAAGCVCGAALLVAGALVIRMLARTRHGAVLRQKVWYEWRNRSDLEVQPRPPSGGRRVLLVYALDCAHLMRVVRLLKIMLSDVGCEVVDIFSSECVAASARAPGEWLRRLVLDQDTRLLLLQTPAAAALYGARLTTGTERPPQLLSPLLGRAAVRRAPHPGDASALLALRLLGDLAHRPLAYRKCYIAGIKGLEAELVPGVTPQRRYMLPDCALELLRDLTPAPPEPKGPDKAPAPSRGAEPRLTQATRELAAAVDELYRYVRENPNYLTDELLFI